MNPGEEDRRMNTLSFPDIPRSVLARLLDLAGSPRDLSPRTLLGPPCRLNRKQISELYSGRIVDFDDDGRMRLSPEFGAVAGVILSPRTTVNFRAWGDGGGRIETSILFPGAIAEGRGVALNQIGTDYRIRAFADDDTVIDMVRPLLPAQDGPAMEFESLTDAPTAAVLFGMIDLAREKMKAAVRDAIRPSPVVFSLEEIFRHLTEAWGLTGPKDLITYVAVSGLLPAPPGSTEMVKAVGALCEAKALVRAPSGAYILAPVVEALARFSEGIQGGIQWQRAGVLPSGEVEVTNRTFVYGTAAPILCFAPGGDGQVWVSAVQKRDLSGFLASEIASGLPVPPAPAPPCPQPRPAAPSPPSAAPAPAGSVLRCAACGREAKAGAMFCKHCGAKLDAAAPAPLPSEPPKKVCHGCGTVVRPEAKFCKTCGTPLS
jgi:Double zinc ribbon